MPKIRTLATLAGEAEEAERRLERNPLAAVEVAADTAEFMGAFEETAVDPGDFAECEPGALDWFFDPAGTGGAAGRGGRGGRQ